MSARRGLWTWWVAAAVAVSSTALAGARPNIILLLADDLGWRDLSCCGSPAVETPNLDRHPDLAASLGDALRAGPAATPPKGQP